ncbi:hypothetical protein [uncultured Dubosiella sp.]|uniref:hypothetical protein n=1 Tax=uncultured Dubosiella sp. TaxID=1937011 RepID=UPI00273181C2|nr:hypothetical protein [uncultured Dubosiella sp.]
MSKCKNKNVIDFIKQNKIEPEKTNVVLTVMKDIDACAKITTRRYFDEVGSLPIYRSTAIPEDLINICESTGCKNTGTLFITTDDTADTVTEGETQTYTHEGGAKFTCYSDATEYLAGVLFFYIYIGKEGTYTVNTTISDAADTVQKNADQYTQIVHAERTGYFPITIDLAHMPEKTIGEGWTATTNGVVAKIAISTTNTEEDSMQVGISSISFFDDLKDLEAGEVVILSCVSGISGDDTFEPLEESCGAALIDPNSVDLSREITASRWTPNVNALNPAVEETGEADSSTFVTTVKTVEADPDNEDYGVIHLSNFYVDECGGVYASVKGTCNVTDSVMSRIYGPNLVDLDERQFQVINSKRNPDVKIIGTKIYFNKELIGQDIVLGYPANQRVIEFTFSKETINTKRVKLEYEHEDSDGWTTAYEFRNFLITSFPRSISATDTEFTFSGAPQPDKDGYYYRMKKYNKQGETVL